MRSIRLSVAVALIILVACKDDMAIPAEYQGCCGTELVGFIVGSGKGYIPNAFSPNQDGLNDFFAIHGTPGVVVQELSIKGRTGHTLFEGTDLTPNQPYMFWDGRDQNDNFYRGRFSYEARVIGPTGDPKTISGTACSFLCGEGAIGTFMPSQCKWPSQVGSNGCYDSEIDSNESECF